MDIHGDTIKKKHPTSGPRDLHFQLLVASSTLGAAFIAIFLLVAMILATFPYLCCREAFHGSIPPASSDHVLPVSCHSHNDYWRANPLFSALESGCIGVEADVWVYKNELFVAHGHATMEPHRTLTSMYIDPLVQRLESAAASMAGKDGKEPQGLYKTHPKQTLVLLVDIKSDPEEAWPLLMRDLEPLRRSKFLTSYAGNQKITGPITVVATGRLPLRVIQTGVAPEVRDVFLDAPLSEIQSGHYNDTNSHWASMSFNKLVGRVPLSGLTPMQLDKIRSQVQSAHDYGLQVRFWRLPAWPTELRNKIWATLLEEGVDILNADDLKGVANALQKNVAL